MTARLMYAEECTSTDMAGPQEPLTYYYGAPLQMMQQVYARLSERYPLPPLNEFIVGEGINDEARLVVVFPHFNIHIVHNYHNDAGRYKFHCYAAPRLRAYRRGLWVLMDVFDIEGLGSLLSAVQMVVDHCRLYYTQCISCFYTNDTADQCGVGMTMNTGTCNQWESYDAKYSLQGG